MAKEGIGVFGGDENLVLYVCGAKKDVLIESGSRSGISQSDDTWGAICGSSIVGIGISAAATEARKCSVGACKFDTFRRLTFKRFGRGGEGGPSDPTRLKGSGVVG